MTHRLRHLLRRPCPACRINLDEVLRHYTLGVGR